MAPGRERGGIDHIAGNAAAWATRADDQLAWPDDPGIEFHLGHGDWVRLLRRNGFVIEGLIELRVPEGAVSAYDFVPAAWARDWPCEEAWRARRT